ncbi:MAG: DUF1501 domain-containing protein, partial [Planctomycetaceae bacterium]|nr:DUF1501 domain-containing protein [Planctomycetaceae bacterium]
MSANIARRQFFGDCGVGVGKIALASLLTNALQPRTSHAEPLAAKPSLYRPTAKAVIHLFMAGAPSQLDLFDNKPTLKAYEGKPIPPAAVGRQRYAFIRPDANCL